MLFALFGELLLNLIELINVDEFNLSGRSSAEYRIIWRQFQAIRKIGIFPSALRPKLYHIELMITQFDCRWDSRITITSTIC